MKEKIPLGVDSNNSSKLAFSSIPAQQSVVVGAVGLLIYILTWLMSVLVPLLAVVIYAFTPAKEIAYALAIPVILAFAAPRLLTIRPQPQVAQFFSRVVPSYFRSCSMLLEDKAVFSRPNNPTLLCVHPHGIFCTGWGIMFVREETKGVHFCFSSALYESPFFRILCMLIGRPSPVDRGTISNLMKKRENLALIPGGFEESTIFVKGTDRIWLKNRKGFVKYALQYGYSLTPVYVFGERDTYWNLQGFWPFRLFLNRFGIPAVVPFGKWWCPLLPVDTELHIVIGKPLQLPQIPNPQPSDIDQYHQLYIESLTQLYHKYFPIYYPSKVAKLEIW